MKICPKFVLVAAEGGVGRSGFRFGTSRKILTRQQNRRSLLARAEQHQSREIDQLRQNQCTPRSPLMLVSGQSAEIARPGRHR